MIHSGRDRQPALVSLGKGSSWRLRRENGQRWELRDASGATVGYHVPVSELERQKQLEAERLQLQRTAQELSEECAALRNELAEVRTEQDQYLEALYARTRTDFSFTEEELRDLEHSGVTSEQVLAEIDKVLRT